MSDLAVLIDVYMSLEKGLTDKVEKQFRVGKHIISILPEEGSTNESDFDLSKFNLKDLPRNRKPLDLLFLFLDMNDYDKSLIAQKALLYKKNTQAYFASLESDTDKEEFFFKKGSKQMEIFMTIDDDIRKELNKAQRKSNLLPFCPDNELVPFPEDVVLITNNSGYIDDVPHLTVEGGFCLKMFDSGVTGGWEIKKRSQIREPSNVEYLIMAIKSHIQE